MKEIEISDNHTFQLVYLYKLNNYNQQDTNLH